MGMGGGFAALMMDDDDDDDDMAEEDQDMSFLSPSHTEQGKIFLEHTYQASCNPCYPFFIGRQVSGAVCSPVLGSHIPGQTISFSTSHFAGSNFWACAVRANARTKMQAFMLNRIGDLRLN